MAAETTMMPVRIGCFDCSILLDEGNTECPNNPEHEVLRLFRPIANELLHADIKLLWDFAAKIGNAHVAVSDQDMPAWPPERVAEATRHARVPLHLVTGLQAARERLIQAQLEVLEAADWNPEAGTVGAVACDRFERNPLGVCRFCGFSVGAHDTAAGHDDVEEHTPDPDPAPRRASIRDSLS